MTSLYRVVCGISEEKGGKIYAAVHKAEKGLHSNMFMSLQMENPDVSDMKRIGGSMYLDDLGSGPKFIIAPDVLRESKVDLKALLTGEVIKTFNKMKKEGKDSSLLSYYRDVEYYAKLKPTSAISARVCREAQEELARQKRLQKRIYRENKNSDIPSWKEFQSKYSGD